MMLIVDAPDGTDLDAVREELARTRDLLSLDAVSLSPLAERGEAEPPSRPSHIVTVYGVDHPGIVHAVSARLAARGVNVTDLETRLAGEELYAMVLEIALPAELDPEALAAMLAEVSAEQGVEVTVRPLEADVM
jgi:glycine cleavage system transcriptional repressor